MLTYLPSSRSSALSTNLLIQEILNKYLQARAETDLHSVKHSTIAHNDVNSWFSV